MDWLGSTRYVTDSTGSTTLAAQSYDAWGQRDAQAPGSPNHPTDLQWAGSWGYQTEWSNGASEPGLRLEYLQQRYYDPALGRFISPDPLGFAAGTNLYQYAGSDPVNGVDPLGLEDGREPWQNGLENFFGGVGGGVGGFFGGGGLAIVTTGPGAIITGPPAAFELGAAGSIGGYAGGRLLGRALGTVIMNAISSGGSAGTGGSSGGGSGCNASPPEPQNFFADRFSDDSFLWRKMREAFKSQQTVKEYYDLIGKFEAGNLSPSLGNEALGKGIFYLRGRLGTRIFLQQIDANIYELLGIANKSNEAAVIKYLSRLAGIR